jgi:hypothetical protein
MFTNINIYYWSSSFHSKRNYVPRTTTNIRENGRHCSSIKKNKSSTSKFIEGYFAFAEAYSFASSKIRI